MATRKQAIGDVPGPAQLDQDPQVVAAAIQAAGAVVAAVFQANPPAGFEAIKHLTTTGHMIYTIARGVLKGVHDGTPTEVGPGVTGA